MKISSLFTLLTPLVTISQMPTPTTTELPTTINHSQDRVSEDNNAVGNIGEQTWDFPPHSHIHLKYNLLTPYNAILDGYKGYEISCYKFIDKNTNNPIVPKFHFYHAHNTTPISFSDCNHNTIEPGYIVVESPELTFRHTHNADVYILNESDVHILGIDCRSGL